ncbi:MAG: mechanosensitive ion channel domain-containing protein [Caulobacteraceae bacterium]
MAVLAIGLMAASPHAARAQTAAGSDFTNTTSPAAAPSTTAAPAKPAAIAAQPLSTGPAVAGPIVAPGAPLAVPLPVATTPSPPNLQVVQQNLNQLQSQVQTTTDDAKLVALRNQFAATQTQVDGVVIAQSKDLAAIDHQLAQLPPTAAHHKETPAERRARDKLTAQRNTVAAQLKQAQSVEAAASSAYDLAAQRQRDAFSARVFKRSASPVSPAFWTSLQAAIGPDSNRLLSAAQDEVSVALHAHEPLAGAALAVALGLAFALMFPLRKIAEKLGRPKSEDRAGHNFARTAHALWIAIVDTLAASLAFNILHLGAQWGGLLSDRADAMFNAGWVAITWGAAILALGHATVANKDPNSRLIPAGDDAIARIRTYLWIIAVVTGTGFLLTRLNDVVGASVAATVAANCVQSLAYVTIITLILFSFGQSRAPTQGEASDETPAQVQGSSAWTLASLALTAAIVVTLGALFAGYTTLAAWISNQIFWLSVLAAATYLLLRFADDLSAVLFQGRGWAARMLFTLFSLRTSTIDQLGVLVSAGLQLIIVVGVVSLALTPFGQSGNILISHFSQIGATIHIGSATISPKAVLAGLASLVIGMGLAHLVRGWVVRRYLPVTDWDSGVRNSVATGVGYVGVAIALLCALSAMGLGFKQIALVASALSVGIGFGLQQVVQNFVSGVILLIERPVKVGDWVNIGGLEGDIRSIRVRATEIQTFDRTTLIVPNSDLITKTVQNKTLGDPRGRIQLDVSIADPADARRATDLILALAKARPEILQDPEPKVFIDSLTTGGSVNFRCYLYVDSPRDVYKTKSAMYFDVLEAFAKGKVAFLGSAGPQNIVIEPGPSLQGLLDTATKRGATDLKTPQAPTSAIS